MSQPVGGGPSDKSVWKSAGPSSSDRKPKTASALGAVRRTQAAASRQGVGPSPSSSTEVIDLPKGRVPLPQKTPTEPDFVTKAREGKGLSEKERRKVLIWKRLCKKNLSQGDAEKIARGLVNGGEGLVVEKKVRLVEEKIMNSFGEYVSVVRPKPYVDGEPLREAQTVITKTLPSQIHGIRGVNVHKDPKTDQMVVDIGLKSLAIGSSKRIKDVFQVTSMGRAGPIVRHTIKEGDKLVTREGGVALELTEMMYDEQTEIKIRKELEGVSGIVPIHSYEYINSDGEYRKRFLSERCDGDLSSLVFAKKRGGELEPLPKEKRHTKEALGLLSDACSIFEQIHKKGVAFLDLRLPNILMKDGAPMISDMGSCASMGGPCISQLPGDTQIRPPEVLFAERGKEPKLDPSLDIYAFGLALWEAYDPEGVDQFRDARFDGRALRTIAEVLAEKNGTQITPDVLRESRKRDTKKSKELLDPLQKSKDPVKRLIADLLNPDPRQRPRSFGEIRKRLTPALEGVAAQKGTTLSSGKISLKEMGTQKVRNTIG